MEQNFIYGNHGLVLQDLSNFYKSISEDFKSIFLFITLISTAGIHKYYVSTTLIDKDQKDNYYKVTLKAFYDDIELELGLDDRVVNYKDEYSYLKELFNGYLKKILFNC